MRKRLLKSRFTLVLLGLALGWLARIVLGVPAEETGPSRVIDRQLPPPSEEVIDLPILNPDGSPKTFPGDESGLVEPLRLPGVFFEGNLEHQGDPSFAMEADEDFAHDSNATFEAHGEQVCASGCAASRHPTERLTRTEFRQLLKEYTFEPMDQTNNALESLLYYGPQTRRLMESEGVGQLDSQRAGFLWEQLMVTHAKISIRVTDDQGVVRTWIDPTRVPFDRRHVFEMQTNDVQPLVTSGTVKRVGLNHHWVRL